MDPSRDELKIPVVLGYLGARGLLISRRVKKAVRRSLGRVEERLGAFLPYHLSDMQAGRVQCDDLLRAQESGERGGLFRRNAHRCSCRPRRDGKRFLSALPDNPRLNAVLLLNRSTRAFVKLGKRVQANPKCRWLPLTGPSVTRDLLSVFAVSGATADLIWGRRLAIRRRDHRRASQIVPCPGDRTH